MHTEEAVLLAKRTAEVEAIYAGDASSVAVEQPAHHRVVVACALGEQGFDQPRAFRETAEPRELAERTYPAKSSSVSIADWTRQLTLLGL